MSAGDRRNKFVLVVLLAVSGLVLLWMGYIQIGRHSHYKKLAEDQHTDSLKLSPDRGQIYDCQGRALALNHSYYLVYVSPWKVRCKDSLVSLLAAAGLGSEKQVRQELGQHDQRFCFSRQLDRIQRDSLWRMIVKYRVGDCTELEGRIQRQYPHGAACADVVGFIGIEDGGLAGIETWYDSILRGQSGWELMLLDGSGHRLPYPSFPRVEPVKGAEIHLTLDADIQAICYRALGLVVDRTVALRGAVVVLDVATGAILGMVDYPTYDPVRFRRYSQSLYPCTAVYDQFEPGSSFKIVICASALESPNAYKLTSQKYDVSEGLIEIQGEKIRDVHKHGILDFDGLLVQSSNPGVSMLSLEVDKELFYSTARALGFGSRVGIGLPGEARGMLDKPSKLTALRMANNAFGQGVSVTLLQLAAAYLCLTNDGAYVRPFLIRSVEANGRSLRRFRRVEVRQTLSKQTAVRTKEILAKVVTEGTGTMAAIPGTEVCGKTGTAQKLEPDGTYSDTLAVMSFVGFFPKERPRYVIAVMIDEPKTNRFSSGVTCPLFKDIGEQLLMLERMRSREPTIYTSRITHHASRVRHWASCVKRNASSVIQ